MFNYSEFISYNLRFFSSHNAKNSFICVFGIRVYGKRQELEGRRPTVIMASFIISPCSQFFTLKSEGFGLHEL